MADVLGYRAKIGVLVPATNTVVEPELYAMAPRGVTIHTGRFSVGQKDLHADRPDLEVLEAVNAELEPLVRQIARCAPSHVIMGISAPSYWGGREGSRIFSRRLEEQAGVPVTTGAGALDSALKTLGVQRVALITPYAEPITARVRRFLEESGYAVIAARSLGVPSALEIAEVPPERLRAELIELDRAGPQAIVQSGTNLPMARLADEAERWLGKPVVSINAALLWDAVRRVGIADRIEGFGSLLREH